MNICSVKIFLEKILILRENKKIIILKYDFSHNL